MRKKRPQHSRLSIYLFTASLLAPSRRLPNLRPLGALAAFGLARFRYRFKSRSSRYSKQLDAIARRRVSESLVLSVLALKN